MLFSMLSFFESQQFVSVMFFCIKTIEQCAKRMVYVYFAKIAKFYLFLVSCKLNFLNVSHLR